MKLTKVRLNSVRGLATRELDLTSAIASRRPFLITGPAGSGKTTVLEAIAAAKENASPYGLNRSSADFLAPDKNDGAITLTWRSHADEDRMAGPEEEVPTTWSLRPSMPSTPMGNMRVRHLLGRYDLDPTHFKVEYFHVGRSLDVDDTQAVLGLPAAEATRRLRRDERKYRWVRQYLSKLGESALQGIASDAESAGVVFSTGRPQPFGRFANGVTALSPNLRFAGVKPVDSGWACTFLRRHAPEAELSKLSTSELVVVLFAATVAALGLERSLLLIDTPELGLNPDQHLPFLNGLASWLPDAQIIAATTSPTLLADASPEHVAVLP